MEAVSPKTYCGSRSETRWVLQSKSLSILRRSRITMPNQGMGLTAYSLRFAPAFGSSSCPAFGGPDFHQLEPNNGLDTADWRVPGPPRNSVC